MLGDSIEKSSAWQEFQSISYSCNVMQKLTYENVFIEITFSFVSIFTIRNNFIDCVLEIDFNCSIIYTTKIIYNQINYLYPNSVFWNLRSSIILRFIYKFNKIGRELIAYYWSSWYKTNFCKCGVLRKTQKKLHLERICFLLHKLQAVLIKLELEL